MFIKIDANPDGSHAFQAGGVMCEGWAFVPENIELPLTFPFVELQVEEVAHPAVTTIVNEIVDGESVEVEKVLEPEYTRLEVVSMTEGEELPVEEVLAPTRIDVIEAQVTYTAMMTDTLLEV